MALPRPISYPITLTTPQLAYLLATVRAETLLGGDDGALFPRDQAEREALWQRGREELERDGWLVWDDVARHYRMNDHLLEIVAVLADPRLALLTRWKAGGEERGVAHYLTPDYVAEMAAERGTYTIVVLPAVATMAQRLVNAIDFPESRPAEVVFTLARDEVERAKRDPDPARLEAQGLTPQAAALFAATLRSPDRYGTATLLRTRLGKAVRMRLLGFLISFTAAGWLATPLENEQVRYWTAGAEEFTSELMRLIAELLDSPTEALQVA